jgi:hypothetical protein
MASNREKAMEMLRSLISQTKDHPELFEHLKTTVSTQLTSMIADVMEPDPDGGFVVDFFEKPFRGNTAESIAHQILDSELKELK